MPVTEMGSQETADLKENRDTPSGGSDGYSTKKDSDGKVVSEKSNKEELWWLFVLGFLNNIEFIIVYYLMI